MYQFALRKLIKISGTLLSFLSFFEPGVEKNRTGRHGLKEASTLCTQEMSCPRTGGGWVEGVGVPQDVQGFLGVLVVVKNVGSLPTRRHYQMGDNCPHSWCVQYCSMYCKDPLFNYFFALFLHSKVTIG